MARSIWQSHEMRHVLTADACLSRTMHTMSCCSRCGGRARQCRGPCHIRPMASMQCDARACADRFGLPRSGIKQLSCRADRAEAVHRFVVCAMQASEPTPRLVLWVFQPLITLSIPPLERPCDACKLLYKPGATQPDMAQHIPLVLPAEVCDALHDALQDSAQIYPASRRVLGDWHVGWLPRRWI